jgi:hypothetical protein
MGKMDDYLALACTYLNVSVGQVISHKIYSDHISLVVDKGIAGCPKYSLSLSGLTSSEPTPTDISEPIQSKGSSFDALDTDELRSIAKEVGVKSYWNMKRETLIERLKKVFDGT